MKGYRFINYVLSAAFAFVVMPNLFTTGYAQARSAEWTLMFYMDSDNDLEGAQMEDLDEMMAVGSTAAINIIALVDRNVKGERDDEDPNKYTNRSVGRLKNWKTAKLMIVEKGKLRELADWGEINMGDPANLTRFVETVYERFPAKRMGLVFGDHGGGWVGVGGDESANSDGLDMVELQAAFRGFTPTNGKFDLIGFDACLMANFEVAKALAPYSKVLVASEELEPGYGWNYTPLFTRFNKNPAMDGFALGRIIVDTYRDFYLAAEQGQRDYTVTLGVIDLGKIPALEAAINELGTRTRTFMNSDGESTWIQTATARSNSESYGVGRNEFYDVIDLATKTKLEKPDANTIRAADAVIAATKAAVAYKINGSARPRSSGLSIYFPESGDPLIDQGYNLTPFSLTGKWFPFIGDFHNIRVEDKVSPELEDVASTDAQIAESDTPTVTAKVNADDLDEATFILAELDGDRQIIIGAVPAEPDDSGVLTEEWDGAWFTIGNEDKELICPITGFEEIDGRPDVYLAEVSAQIRKKGGRQWRDITIYFVLDFNQDEAVGEFVYAFEFQGSRAREVAVDPGDTIRPVYLVVDENGETDELAATDPADMIQIKSPDGLAVGTAAVAAGKYLIGFLVTDFSGNTDAALVDVTIE